MSLAPSVIHFKCLDTMGLRAAAKAIGAGRAGVRLTQAGLAIYRRGTSGTTGTRQGPPPLPPPEPIDALPLQVASSGPASFEFAREPACESPPSEEPRETLAPCMVTRGEPAEPEPILIELGLRRPTIWAVAFLTIGITFGAAIARVVAAGAPVSAASAGVVLTETAPGPVSWPLTTRGEAAPLAVMPEPTNVPTSSSPAGADPQLDPAHASIAPTRAQHSRHHRVQAATGTDAAGRVDETAPAAPVKEPTDSEDAEATVARARAALTDAL